MRAASLHPEHCHDPGAAAVVNSIPHVAHFMTVTFLVGCSFPEDALQYPMCYDGRSNAAKSFGNGITRFHCTRARCSGASGSEQGAAQYGKSCAKLLL